MGLSPLLLSVDIPSLEAMSCVALFILKRSLDGPAALMLQSLSDSQLDSHVEIEQALQARFGDRGRESVLRAELHSRNRIPGESISELGDAIHGNAIVSRGLRWGHPAGCGCL